MIVSHSFEFTESLNIDSVYLMDGGKIIRTGGTEILRGIKNEGFNE